MRPGYLRQPVTNGVITQAASIDTGRAPSTATAARKPARAPRTVIPVMAASCRSHRRLTLAERPGRSARFAPEPTGYAVKSPPPRPEGGAVYIGLGTLAVIIILI